MSESEYLNMVNSLKKRYKVAMSLDDWFGLPIVIFRLGGREEPPILITAGASGIEVAGVYAAFELILQVDVDRTVYILPSRDPTGFHDISFILSRMLGENLIIRDVRDMYEILKSYDAEILIDDQLFFALLKGIGIACSEDLSAYNTLKLLEKRIRESDLLESLDETRILVTSQMSSVEGVGALGRCISSMLLNSKLVTYDDFHEKCIPETAQLRNFINLQQPGMVIDLHEGEGDGFYVLVKEDPAGNELTIIDLVLDQVNVYGMRLASAETSFNQNVTSLREGLLVGMGRCGLIDYVAQECYAFGFTTPWNHPLEQRIKTLLTACLSALNAYAVAGL
ncbi:MAG: hypothetical protein QW291_04565 [Thermofilaceae archaeon]